ncbi:MAG: desulfoferrodoxin [Firmicutes bacterium]|nr:desulfoferrodoxin [Bacillota bacterium]
MSATRFYLCKHCGNLVGLINNAGVPLVCCGEPMQELIAGSVDASKEKHVPQVSVDGNLLHVNIGSVDHPMQDEHYIQWVFVQTEHGGQRKNLRPGQEPKVTFALADDRAISVYAYCNLHGLWKTDL